jgi:hypothetical protein
MTKMIFDSEEDNINDLWTTGRLIDELFLNLDLVETYDSQGKLVTVSRYYDQAREIISQLSISKCKVELLFVIHISDLSEKVRKEMVDYYNDAGKIAFTILLKQAISRIFENVQPGCTQLSVMKNLRVKFIV